MSSKNGERTTRQSGKATGKARDREVREREEPVSKRRKEASSSEGESDSEEEPRVGMREIRGVIMSNAVAIRKVQDQVEALSGAVLKLANPKEGKLVDRVPTDQQGVYLAG